jgi:hypothetical protein
MSIVLQSSSGGSVTIAEPATASNFTQTLPAASGEVMVSGNQPAFGAFSSVGTSISANTWTKLNFNSEEFDTANAFDSTTNFRFTPQVNGYYQINAAWQSSAIAGNAYIAIYKNGSIAKFGSVLVAGTVGCEPVVSSLIALNGSTDYVEIYAFSSVSSTATSQAINTYVNGYLARTA